MPWQHALPCGVHLQRHLCWVGFVDLSWAGALASRKKLATYKPADSPEQRQAESPESYYFDTMFEYPQ